MLFFNRVGQMWRLKNDALIFIIRSELYSPNPDFSGMMRHDCLILSDFEFNDQVGEIQVRYETFDRPWPSELRATQIL